MLLLFVPQFSLLKFKPHVTTSLKSDQCCDQSFCESLRNKVMNESCSVQTCTQLIVCLLFCTFSSSVTFCIKHRNKLKCWLCNSLAVTVSTVTSLWGCALITEEEPPQCSSISMVTDGWSSERLSASSTMLRWWMAEFSPAAHRSLVLLGSGCWPAWDTPPTQAHLPLITLPNWERTQWMC